MSKVVNFIRSRPTEVWLGLWTAAVAIMQASGLDLKPALVSAIGTGIAWICTAVASRPSNNLGPPGKPSSP